MTHDGAFPKKSSPDEHVSCPLIQGEVVVFCARQWVIFEMQLALREVLCNEFREVSWKCTHGLDHGIHGEQCFSDLLNTSRGFNYEN